MIVESKNLIVRTITKKDVAVLFEIYSDAEAMKFRGSKSFETIIEAEKLVINIEKNMVEKKEFRYGIIEKTSNLLIGTFLYTPITKKQCKIGYSIGKKHWRKGYATEVITMMTNNLKQLGFEELIAIIKKENQPSINLIEKLNFKLINSETFFTYQKHL